MSLTLSEVIDLLAAAGLGARRERADEAPVPIEGYSIDSRTLRAGELFFAIAGDRFDGHDFVEAALGAGAAGAVIAADRAGRYSVALQPRLVPTRDPVAALQALAQAVRRRWREAGGGRRLAAVTGSAGKTTTKDMIAVVLGTGMSVLKTEGNLNNQYGLPLTLLRLEEAHRAAVVEMGMNHAGEIAHLCSLAEPDLGVFTNIGEAHLGNFASIDELAEAKRELARALPSTGVMIVNADDARIAGFAAGFGGRVRSYGTSASASLQVRDIKTAGAAGSRFAVIDAASGARVRVALQYPGLGHIANAAAALATGLEFGIELAAGAAALKQMTPPPGRGASRLHAGMRLIDDTYNANPAAMEVMLQMLADTPARRRVAVLGEMLELGESADALHGRVGRRAAAIAAAGGLDALFTVRGHARQIAEAAQAAGFAGATEFCPDAVTCGARLREYLRSGDAVLFKASRGVRLDAALRVLTGNETAGPH